MRKINLVIVISLLLISCGKNSEKKDEINVVTANDCNCSELNLPETKNIIGDEKSIDESWKSILKDGKPYSGNCIEKDQYDSIIKKFEFKNGWIVKKTLREKMNNTYTSIFDLSYDNLQEMNGFKIELGTDEDVKYVKNLIVVKSGKIDNDESYKISISKSAVIPINERFDDYTEQFIWDSVDGLSFEYSKNIKSKITGFLPKLKSANNNAITDESEDDTEQFYIENATPQQRNELLEYLKKNVPKFNYQL